MSALYSCFVNGSSKIQLTVWKLHKCPNWYLELSSYNNEDEKCFILKCNGVSANTKFSVVNVFYINKTDILNEILFLNSTFFSHICSRFFLSFWILIYRSVLCFLLYQSLCLSFNLYRFYLQAKTLYAQ
jgi:hypothetical protein